MSATSSRNVRGKLPRTAGWQPALPRLLPTRSSFCPQGLHGINSRRAKRGNETGQGSDAADKEGDAAIEPRIARTHFEEQTLHEPCHGQGETEPDHQSDDRKPQSFLHDEADDIASGGAEGEA